MAKRIYNSAKRREWYIARTAADVPSTGRAERDVQVPYNEAPRVCACGARLSGYNPGDACLPCLTRTAGIVSQIQTALGSGNHGGGRGTAGGAELVWLDFVDYL